MKRLLSLFAAFALLFALAPTTLATYTDYCSAGEPSTAQFSIARVNATYTAARGWTQIGYYNACDGSQGQGLSISLLAAIDGDSGSGFNEPRCAIGKITSTGGLNYWYTPYNDGGLAAFGTAISHARGDQVYCTITAASNNRWQYTIHNNTTGESSTVYSSRKGAGGTVVWWGFEVHNTADQMGGRDTSDDEITNIGYKFSGDSSWWYATNDNGGGVKYGYWPSYWHASITIAGPLDFDVLHAYTDQDAH